MRRAIFAAGAFLLPMVASAGWSAQSVTITGYYVWDSAAAYLKTSNNENPGNACTSAQYLGLDTTQSNFKAIWAQIISAHAQGLTVSLFYDGCIGTPPENWPKIRAVAVPTIW